MDILPQIRYIKFPFLFDVPLLQQEVQKLLQRKWVSHYNTQGYKGNWSAIALLSPNGEIDAINAFSSKSDVLQETELLSFCPYLKKVLDEFLFDKTAVRLLNLAVGAAISPHKDYCLGYEDNCFRIHIPIITNPNVEFILDNERLVMNEGECWYIDANFTHSVINRGDKDRIHLVIDGIRNNWTDTLFFKEASPEQFISPKPEMDNGTKQRIIEELKLMNTSTSLKMIQDLR